MKYSNGILPLGVLPRGREEQRAATGPPAQRKDVLGFNSPTHNALLGDNMRGLRCGLLFIVFALSVETFAQQATRRVTDLCQRTSIPLIFPPGVNFKLGVVNHFLEFEPEVEGVLFLRNDTGRQIRGITMLVNYEDEQGHRLFTLTYQATVKGYSQAQTNIRPFYKGSFTRPVEPGEVFDLSGTNLLTTTKIPAKASVSVIDLNFPGTGVYTGSLVFQSDPILEQAPPQYLQLAVSADNLPEDMLLKLSISPRGIVKTVDLASETEPPNPTLTSVMEEIRKWHFFPAIRNGFGVASDLFLLLRFRGADEPPMLDCFIGQGNKYPTSFVIVTLEPVPSLKGRWRFFYDKYEVSAWNGPFLGQQAFESAPWRTRDP